MLAAKKDGIFIVRVLQDPVVDHGDFHDTGRGVIQDERRRLTSVIECVSARVV